MRQQPSNRAKFRALANLNASLVSLVTSVCLCVCMNRHRTNAISFHDWLTKCRCNRRPVFVAHTFDAFDGVVFDFRATNEITTTWHPTHVQFSLAENRFWRRCSVCFSDFSIFSLSWALLFGLCVMLTLTSSSSPSSSHRHSKFSTVTRNNFMRLKAIRWQMFESPVSAMFL